MKSKPLVSILINNYNYGHFLKAAIDSALEQTYSHIEVIVVDDGSTDNSREVIASYGDRLIPILKENSGQASAFNVGFAASQGDIICFLDSDDVFIPEKVEHVVDIFAKFPDIGWCFHALKLIDFDQNETIKNNHQGISGRYDLTSYIKKGKLKGKVPFDGTATSGTCFQRSCLQSILPMPEQIKITSDDYIKYVAFGIRPGYILLEELALQRIHTSNAFTLRTDKQQLRAKINILTAYWMRKNFPALSQFANNILAVGISQYRQTEGKQLEVQKIVKQYLESIPLIEKIELYLRAIYYRLKP
ncbi:glycosyltransferase family 2 protein [Calothrix sp. PCC 7507]|uniref:glycosyltransferase family 2 protein n=1 Tax=Calothrix sp. PCC 7507 TaxID=99598 RepID=UPI00029EC6F1|nr:glycosyltransferase [Calothrix sp. PCC 7507]AFY32693.1 glycosyl transferase family 2 [Calothrix sp. PCC 7507]